MLALFVTTRGERGKMNQCRVFGYAGLTAVLALGSALSYAQEDSRNLIVLRPKERALMLEDMRNYLAGIRQLTAALAKEDRDATVKAARSMGKIAIYEMKPVITPSQLPRFRQLAVKVHDDFEAFAADAAAGKPALELLGDLSRAMHQCVKCHESYYVGTYAHDH